MGDHSEKASSARTLDPSSPGLRDTSAEEALSKEPQKKRRGRGPLPSGLAYVVQNIRLPRPETALLREKARAAGEPPGTLARKLLSAALKGGVEASTSAGATQVAGGAAEGRVGPVSDGRMVVMGYVEVPRSRVRPADRTRSGYLPAINTAGKAKRGGVRVTRTGPGAPWVDEDGRDLSAVVAAVGLSQSPDGADAKAKAATVRPRW